MGFLKMKNQFRNSKKSTEQISIAQEFILTTIFSKVHK
jgi:hypothetical protein